MRPGLLPGRKLSVNDGMDVLVDEMPTRSTDERGKILCAANMNSVAVQYTDVLNMKRAERRELVSGKEVVYIYHNTIDAIGDKVPTEKKVFEACEDAMQELSNILRIVINDMQGTDIFITADHGFLYTYSPLTEGDKLGKDAISGKCTNCLHCCDHSNQPKPKNVLSCTSRMKNIAIGQTYLMQKE